MLIFFQTSRIIQDKFQELILNFILSSSDREATNRKDWENPNLVPECVSSHVKTCTSQNFV